MTLELHFSAIRSSGLSLRFRSITDYLRGLFLRAGVSDYWWCPSTDRLLYTTVMRDAPAPPTFCSKMSRDEFIMLFFLTYYAFKQFPRNVPIMLKKVPIMPGFFFSQQNALFSRLQTRIAHFARSQKAYKGDFSLPSNEATRTSTSRPGSWESSGSLLELSKAAGPLLLPVLDSILCCCSDLLLFVLT